MRKKAYVKPWHGKFGGGELVFTDGTATRYMPSMGPNPSPARMVAVESYMYDAGRNLDERELDERAKRGPYQWKGRSVG